MKIIWAVVLLPLLWGCNNDTSSPVEQPKATVTPVEKPAAENPYCYFFAAQLYNHFGVSITDDTLSVYHDNLKDKTWFDNDHKALTARDTNVVMPSGGNGNTFFVSLVKGSAGIKYTAVSRELKSKIQKAGVDANFGKVQRFNDDYFLINKNDTNPYPFIFVYHEKTEKVDTIVWHGHITEDKIEDFFLYDFKHDGYIDVFVISKDTIHEGAFGITGIATSPAWTCPDKFKPDNPGEN